MPSIPVIAFVTARTPNTGLFASTDSSAVCDHIRLQVFLVLQGVKLDIGDNDRMIRSIPGSSLL